MTINETIRGILSFCIIVFFAAAGRAQEAAITVNASQPLHILPRYLTGACLEDVNHEVYGGLYSQMIFGESFQEPASTQSGNGVSGMWQALRRGTATGEFSLESSNAFVGSRSQVIRFSSGNGEIGIENQGLNHWGMNFEAGNEYDGCLDARADTPTPITVALESSNGSAIYAQTNLLVTSNDWERLNFSLTPSSSGSDGRFAITLTEPGSVVVGYAFLEPGAWGQYEGLPVRKDVAEGLINQGITVLRYGGSMVNAAGYRWKNMIGPRDRRPPYAGTWYGYSSDGWGIPDFLNFCEAAGFLGVPDFNINETPQAMADFMEYVNGRTNTVWGAQRLADGHPQPYNLKYLELGNEETVNSAYYQKFRALAQAIWVADPNVTLVVGDFSYHQIIIAPHNFHGADSGITNLSAQQKILQLARQYNREVWFDVHVWTDGPTPDGSLAGMFSFDDALGKITHGAKYKVVVFELNANHHDQGRALANALAINAAERDGRLPMVTSANCLQPDGENDNGWDQGLLFLNPAQVWLQPPGYVMRIFSRHHERWIIKSDVKDPGHYLNVVASRSDDGKTLVLDVVNSCAGDVPATIVIDGYSFTRQADIECLSGPLKMTNTAMAQNQIHPIQKIWQPDFKMGQAEYEFPRHSITAIQFNQ